MRVQVSGTSESTAVLRGYLQRAGDVIVWKEGDRGDPDYTIYLEERKAKEVYFESVHCDLELAIMRYVRQKTNLPLVLCSPHPSNRSDRSIRIVFPPSEAQAIELSVQMGFADLVAPHPSVSAAAAELQASVKRIEDLYKSLLMEKGTVLLEKDLIIEKLQMQIAEKKRADSQRSWWQFWKHATVPVVICMILFATRASAQIYPITPVIQFTNANPSGNACVFTSPIQYFQGTMYTCANGATYASVATSPGGTNLQLQYNSSSTFAGVPSTTVTVSTAAPAAPGVVTVGTPGLTTIGYKAAFRPSIGNSNSSTETRITTANATINGTNYNQITAPTCAGAVNTTVDLFVTTTGGNITLAGFLANVPCGGTYNHQGNTADAGYLAPTSDTSAGIYHPFIGSFTQYAPKQPYLPITWFTSDPNTAPHGARISCNANSAGNTQEDCPLEIGYNPGRIANFPTFDLKIEPFFSTNAGVNGQMEAYFNTFPANSSTNYRPFGVVLQTVGGSSLTETFSADSLSFTDKTGATQFELFDSNGLTLFNKPVRIFDSMSNQTVNLQHNLLQVDSTSFGFIINSTNNLSNFAPDIGLTRGGVGLFEITDAGGAAGRCVNSVSHCRDIQHRHTISSGTAPTLTSGTGTIAGGDERFRVTLTAGAQTTLTVTFGTAYTTNIPVFVCNDETTAANNPVQAAPTLSTVVINATGTFGASDKISCVGGGMIGI